MALDPMFLATRVSILPNIKPGAIYRLNASDAVSASQLLTQIEWRPQSREEKPADGIGGPVLEQAIEICLWKHDMNGWVVMEYDVVNVDPDGANEWWLIKSFALEMMGTRYRCMCVPTQEVA